MLLALVVIVGPFLLVASADRAGSSLQSVGAASGWAILAGFPLAAFVHDAGHALATRHYGRDVRGGIGFFWFSPILYVDTSDMWLAPRRQRIIVTLAGPYAHLMLAGVSGIAMLAVPEGFFLVLLWEFTLYCYLDVVVNLSPLLELDGYYLLVHVLNRPNIRRRSLAFLVEDLPRAVRDRSVLRGHMFELIYALASLLFVAFLAVSAVVMYRLAIEPWLSAFLSASVVSWIGWTLAVMMVALTLAGVIGDIQRATAASRSERL